MEAQQMTEKTWSPANQFGAAVGAKKENTETKHLRIALGNGARKLSKLDRLSII